MIKIWEKGKSKKWIHNAIACCIKIYTTKSEVAYTDEEFAATDLHCFMDFIEARF